MRPPDGPPPFPTWPTTAFPAGLDAGRERLLARLLERIGPDGALRDPCRSRVLESALALALLNRCGLPCDRVRARLMRFLEHRRRSGDPWDAAVARAALDRNPEEPLRRRAIEEFIAQAPDFTGSRKRALIHAIWTMLGAAPASSAPGADAFDLDGLHAWAAVQVTAVKVVEAHAAGHPQPASADEVALLLSTQCPGTVWEGNLLIHLSVLHALARIPGTDATVTEGIRTALLYQRADGGLPFVTDTDTWCTVTAGLALHTARAPEHVLHRIASHLVRAQQSGGGWSYTDRARLCDTDCTTVAVEFLHQLDPATYRIPIRRALAALIQVRGTDGGFPTYGAGTPSEACMTAAAVNALSTQGHRHHDLIQHALLFLAGRQRPDGSFPPGWSNSCPHTLFRAHLAAGRPSLPLPEPVRSMHQRILHQVCSSQNPDGGFGRQDGAASDAISTAYALIVLTGQPDPAPAARASHYLLGRQRPDGGITSPPDMLGPRPFPYQVPVLADIFTLLALGHLTRRTGPHHTLVPCRPHSASRQDERTAP
ncbi:prenyltransferase/squalene oxidase repeat-containing protein [Streptomyces sp. NPDC029003]|uniref:prenyltransferase/squalene oxidase repeat-containing protein n=1 Tax=Streptomyces sp. NPDC029003 TaxID=3155125 RepID=UPI00340C8553